MLSLYTLVLVRLLITVINWPVYFFNRFGWIQETVRYHLWNGMTITSRPYSIDGSALNEVWFERSYDPNAFGIPFDWSSAKHIIDIGGHIGTFTIFAASQAKNALIVTLEPEVSNYAMLTNNITTNALNARITTYKKGLGNDQPITLYTFPGDRGGNSVSRTHDGGIPITIETMSLQTIFDRHHIAVCDYLKIDCEGAEYEALYALPPEYFKRIRMIGLEYHHFSPHPTHNSDHLQRHLEKNGMTVMRHKKSMMLAYQTR